ncbi:MAG TPA: SCO family protein [Planctomycetaceae bacterium]|nr:SCO family protein [Planctomycetaceae bacterium]
MMKPRVWSALGAAAMLTVFMTAGLPPVSPTPVAAQPRWGANYFPNVPLTTQDGDTVKFYDLIRGKVVAISLIYTTCHYSCPLETARLAQVQKLLGHRMGRDVLFVSISINPDFDTPEVLKDYANKYHAGPGWLFVRGKASDVELLSKKLGLYSSPNPDNKDGHTPMLLIGNEPTGQWIHGSAVDNPKYTATMIDQWVGGWKKDGPAKSYAEAKPIVTPARGQYLFSTRCSVCHSIGEGDKVGPDLGRATAMRSRAWLTRYITAPDSMLKHGDPTARALFERYKPAQMPNLSLTASEVEELIGYLESRTPPAP